MSNDQQPDICGDLMPEIGTPGHRDICRRPTQHTGAHVARPWDRTSPWWTEIEQGQRYIGTLGHWPNEPPKPKPEPDEPTSPPTHIGTPMRLLEPRGIGYRRIGSGGYLRDDVR